MMHESFLLTILIAVKNLVAVRARCDLNAGPLGQGEIEALKEDDMRMSRVKDEDKEKEEEEDEKKKRKRRKGRRKRR